MYVQVCLKQGKACATQKAQGKGKLLLLPAPLKQSAAPTTITAEAVPMTASTSQPATNHAPVIMAGLTPAAATTTAAAAQVASTTTGAITTTAAVLADSTTAAATIAAAHPAASTVALLPAATTAVPLPGVLRAAAITAAAPRAEGATKLEYTIAIKAFYSGSGWIGDTSHPLFLCSFTTYCGQIPFIFNVK